MRLLLPSLVLLAACDRSEPVPSAAENRQLDDAARMLDEAEKELANAPADNPAEANSTD